MYIIPHLCVAKHSWNFEILNFQMYIFWIFKVLKFHTFEIVIFLIVSLIGYYHLIFYHQLISIIWILWKFFVKMSFSNDRIFQFQKSLIKPKLKIWSNGFLIWVFLHSYVLKRNNVPWLPWFKWQKINKCLFLWQNFTSSVHCGSFNCVLTH
jgi:hypothetical protein